VVLQELRVHQELVVLQEHQELAEHQVNLLAVLNY
jgi:hypothetical protein